MAYGKEQLIEFLRRGFDIEKGEVFPSILSNQINKYMRELRLTPYEIAQAVSYFVTIKGGRVDLKYGIGIVPSIIEESRAHYAKELKTQAEQRLEMEKNEKKEKRYIVCKKPMPLGRVIPLIDMTKLGVENDE